MRSHSSGDAERPSPYPLPESPVGDTRAACDVTQSRERRHRPIRRPNAAESRPIRGLMEAGVPILGTTVESLDAAGDREQFLRPCCNNSNSCSPTERHRPKRCRGRAKIAKRIGYPVLVRPSFVLGGRAMEIVGDESQLNYYMANAVDASQIANAPILVDKFLDSATEVDVDCVADYDPVGESERNVGSALADASSGTARVERPAPNSRVPPRTRPPVRSGPYGSSNHHRRDGTHRGSRHSFG